MGACAVCIARRTMRAAGALSLWLVWCVALALCAEHEEGDSIPLYANKVGPYANPTEQYEYYTLPFCAPAEEKRQWHDFGEAIQGDRFVETNFKIPFKTDFEDKELCKYTLKPEDIEKFKDAVSNDFFFEFFYDELPLWGFVGEAVTPEANKPEDDEDEPEQDPDEEEKAQLNLFTHYVFELSYNGQHVIEVNWEHDPKKVVDLNEVPEGEGLDIAFTYSARWKPTETTYAERMSKYVQTQGQQRLEIHWFSIMNSVVTAMLLTGFLATILMKVLKNDFSRYSRADEEEDEEEETGWKLVHGDVFRGPPAPLLFSAVLGNGTQLLALVTGLLILAVFGVFYHTNRGALYVAALLLFSFTSGISGYVANAWYQKLGGSNWVRCTVVSWLLYLGPFFFVATCLNFVAVAYKSSVALPFGTVVIILLILALVSLPLTVLGGIAGRNYGTPLMAPCRTNKIPREIPALPWYRHGVLQAAMAGFLPFSAIYIELSELFAAIWGYQMYTLYGILCIVFLILLLVTSFITIALTYFQLAAEDHRWWWRAVLGGGSTGLFVFGKCVYYWWQSSMNGLMQGAFFFGYMGLVCYGTVLMLGSVGFLASMGFVRYIHKNVKID